MPTDIYDYKRILRNTITHMQALPHLSKESKEDMLGFKDELLARGVGAARVARYIFDVRKLHEWHGGDLRKPTLQDVKRLAARIEQCSYAPSTRRDMKVSLRRFIQFQLGVEKVPDVVAWVLPWSHMPKTRRVPEELLSQDDVRRMIDCARSVRDRAFIATLYESGCRIGEILSLRLKHLVPVQPGMVMRVDGKTGPRRVRVISSAPYLTELLNLHPDRRNPDARLWMNRLGRFMSYHGIEKRLKAIAKAAGIRKRIHPHLFRHSRATHLANHLTEAQMKEYFGWVQSSQMAAVYVHLSGRDVDDAILRVHGLKQEPARRDETLQSLPCAKCKTENPAANRFCSLCGHPLSTEASEQLVAADLDRKEADAILDAVIDDPEIRKLLLRRINALRRKP